MRLFIAILFSPEIKVSLLNAIADLRAQADSGVFTRPENLHLTLAFLGEVRDPSGAKQAIIDAAGAPFSLTIGGCGRFGNLWWAGVQETPPLSALSRRLRRALNAYQISYDQKPFRPHITLARQLVCDAPVQLTVPHHAMTVTRLSLMKSERIDGRLIYTEIGLCNLR